MSDQTQTGSLICPKCQSPMRSYERSGVTIDQCTGCRGIFLDRGELERLTDAESEHFSQQGGQFPQASGQYPDPGRAYDEPRSRRRGGFLGGLFDD